MSQSRYLPNKYYELYHRRYYGYSNQRPQGGSQLSFFAKFVIVVFPALAVGLITRVVLVAAIPLPVVAVAPPVIADATPVAPAVAAVPSPVPVPTLPAEPLPPALPLLPATQQALPFIEPVPQIAATPPVAESVPQVLPPPPSPVEPALADAEPPPQSGDWVADALQKPEIRAWLDTIAWAEGADYNVQFSGSRFSGFADHPRQIKRASGLASDAAGRYQFLSTTWDKLGLPDFTPANQDKGAVMLISRIGALSSAEQGEAGVDQTLERISHEWASLPPQRYKGQGVRSNGDVKAYYAGALSQYQQ